MKGEVTDVDASDPAAVELTVEAEDGEVFTSSFDTKFNMARSQNFYHRYGVSVENAKGLTVDVSTDGAPWDEWYHICILD